MLRVLRVLRVIIPGIDDEDNIEVVVDVLQVLVDG